MKKFILVCLMAMGSASLAQVSKPAYLDEGKDIEERLVLLFDLYQVLPFDINWISVLKEILYSFT